MPKFNRILLSHEVVLVMILNRLRMYFLFVGGKKRGMRFLRTRGLFLVCFLFGSVRAGFALWLLDNERQRKKYGFITGLVAIPLSILMFLLAQSAATVMQTPSGIVITHETALKNAPDPNATTVNTLHEGLKIEILQ